MLSRLQHGEEGVLALDQLPIRLAFRIARRLDLHEAVVLEQARAEVDGLRGVREVLEDVIQHDHVEGALGQRLGLEGAEEDRNTERAAGEVDDPRTELESGGVEPGGAHERDERAVSAAELEDARGGRRWSSSVRSQCRQRSGRSCRARSKMSGNPSSSRCRVSQYGLP